MRDADVSPGHEEVIYIAGIKAAIRYGIRVNQYVLGNGLEFSIRKIFAVFRVRAVQIYAPRCCKRSIFVSHIFLYVVFFQDIVAHKTSRFTLTCNVSNPTQFALSEISIIF